MITAGIDVGMETVKAVVWDPDRAKAYSCALPLNQAPVSQTARQAFQAAAAKAEVAPEAVWNIAATGSGREAVEFARSYLGEAVCCARGAGAAAPSAVTVIDLGADKCLAIRCRGGQLQKSLRNDRCASGSGKFLEIAAAPLGVGPKELGQMSLGSRNYIEINNKCAVFAESEIISLIHAKRRPEDIAKAVFRSLARRIYTMAIKLDWEEEVAMVGGVAYNQGMVKALEEELGCRVFVPKEPLVTGALGAALLAAGDRGEGGCL
ncbi:acyl-CoA dehydratase activase [Papillibacter cinnamivorans]|uniref:CoA-substrate-specific enzyme activase, putative n=1 Tax=Papillibacter cinnamivorans DSM 12816 TaxID=1122930 RepID=A0A1W2CBS9_9FIRM|nr:acyl-CoA dehydratase activase [Papillibacter cinnamivorans]SMC82630.1 CoA-substrate-specific enzyme activase, putative [Papillibacter cinnamivorans DSM 12816]